MAKDEQKATHQRALLLARRCSHCAERIEPAVLFRNAPCPRCGRKIEWPTAKRASSLSEVIGRRWRRRRWLIYGLVALSSGLTGFLPVLPTVVATVFMIVLRYSFMREPMAWFSPARKLVTGLNLKLWLVTVSCLTLLMNTLMSFLPFINVPLNAVVGAVMTAIFVEISLLYLHGRLEREEETHELDDWEWGFAALLFALTVLFGSLALGLLIGTRELYLSLFT